MAELRIMITAPLPDDTFQKAKVISSIDEPLSAFEHCLPNDATIEHETSDAKTPKPRKKRADAGKARKATPVIREAAE